MKWITREKARVDRIPCPWLISRFVDKDPVFLFVPAAEVMDVAEREGAVPYDVPGVDLGHHGDRCSFDAFIAKYKLDDPGRARWRSSCAAPTRTSATLCRKRPVSTRSRPASR
jgi:hypothetical protein